MTVRSIYENFKSIEHNYIPSIFRSMVNMVTNLNANYSGEGTYSHPISLYAFYGIFSSASHLSHLLIKQYAHISDPIAYAAPILLGAALQGRPDCPAQIKIEQYPMLSTIAGGLNGFICCYGYSLLKSALQNHSYFQSNTYATAAVAAITFVPVMSKAMCLIESKILAGFQKLFNIDSTSELKPTSLTAREALGREEKEVANSR